MELLASWPDLRTHQDFSMLVPAFGDPGVNLDFLMYSQAFQSSHCVFEVSSSGSVIAQQRFCCESSCTAGLHIDPLTVSPLLTMTAPLACRPISPVSNVSCSRNKPK